MKNNKRENEKAVTLISLIVTVIILIILATVGISTGIETLNSSKLTKFNTEMKIMQLKANEWYDEYMSAKEEKKQEILNRGESIIPGSGQAEVVEQANKVFSIEASGIIFDEEDKREDYRYYSKEKLEELGIEGVDQDFFVNIANRTIVSYKGLLYKGDMYYTISQLPQMDIYNVNYEQNSGEPVFKVKYSEVVPLEKWKIEVYDIRYENGYINKWRVKYRLKGEEKWKISETLEFEVGEIGTYEIKVENNEVESSDPPVEITIEIKAETLPNKPKLAKGMIPVKWENTNWVICSEDDSEWYNYISQESGVDRESKWANVMLSDGKYKEGTTEVENAIKNKTPIEEKDLGSMFVWIPRYAYQIENLYHEESADAGKINVEFLEGTKTYETGDKIISGQLANKSGEGNWNEHPAFNYGGEILEGIWVAKFEASSTTTTPDENNGGGNVTNLNIKVLPGKQAWRSISASNMFTNCINMNNEQNAIFYGISTDDNKIDPHLMKNDEWGAVTYLTQSSYGRNGYEVTPNSNGYGGYKYIYTGYAGDSTSAGNPGDGANKPTNVYYYNTPDGMLASTTGNATGIYDMNGGSWETVAAYISNGSDNLKKQTSLLDADPKYKNVYKAIKPDGSEATAGDDDKGKNYEAAQNVYGDAMWETSVASGGRMVY